MAPRFGDIAVSLAGCFVVAAASDLPLDLVFMARGGGESENSLEQGQGQGRTFVGQERI